ncbi:MAG: hypothetical protein ACI867_001541 [Glaciecola sp.]|jgi:hypothetical protein
MGPGEVKRAQLIGDRVDASPKVAEALDAGQISTDHVRAIDRTLQHLTGTDRQTAETRLVQVAQAGTPRDVADEGVRLLSRLDPETAVELERVKHARRSATVTRHNGEVKVHANLSGLAGEGFMTTFHAFRRPDRQGEERTPAQRSADAIADICEAAMSTFDPPADGKPRKATPRPRGTRGIPPHISVTIDLDTLLTGEGPAETDWSGPIPWGAIRDELEGAGLTFIVVKEQTPIAVTKQTRYLPTGLVKALHLRDRTCVHQSCSIPANWCQAAHLAKTFNDGGKLTLDSGGLLCTDHHRAFDAGQLDVTWRQGKPTVHPPGDPP